MPVYPTIEFRFIRDGFTAPSQKQHDDTLRIKYHHDDEVTVSYKDGKMGAKHSNYFSHERLVDYLTNLFTMVSADDEAFHAVQVNLPLHPCVYYELSTFKRHSIRDAVLQGVKSTLLSWPTSGFVPQDVEDSSSESSKEEDTETESDAESTSIDASTIEDGEERVAPAAAPTRNNTIWPTDDMDTDSDTDSDMPPLMPQDEMMFDYDRLVHDVRRRAMPAPSPLAHPSTTTAAAPAAPLLSGSMNQTTYNAYLGNPYGNTTYTNSLAYYFPTEPHTE
jgi:hypothetical protein